LHLGQGRASIAVCWCSRSWSWGGRPTSAGATISVMTLLSTIEASGVSFIRCCILSGWGPLSTLIPSIQSLKEVGTWNHLSLRGDKSLASWVRHLLRTLWDGAEDRFSWQRTNVDARPGVGALLGLTLLLALACQYSSPVLEQKSLVYHGLKILEVM
jgi:hypothetical protein